MAKDSTTLISPDGREYVTDSATEVNNLVYGAGYRVKPSKGKTSGPTPTGTTEASKTTK